jgi:four helix bundle protein
MSTGTYRELRVWRLCCQLRDRVLAISATPDIAQDFTFCNQLRSTAASPCARIAEGFGRFRPSDFVRFLRLARTSLNELMEHLSQGLSVGLIDQQEHDELVGLARQAGRSITQLIRYLDPSTGSSPSLHTEAES